MMKQRIRFIGRQHTIKVGIKNYELGLDFNCEETIILVRVFEI